MFFEQKFPRKRHLIIKVLETRKKVSINTPRINTILKRPTHTNTEEHQKIVTFTQKTHVI